MAITPLPTPPRRNNPATFADDGDAFLGALPAFVTETNTLAEQVSDDALAASAAHAAADVAIAAANYRGEYSAGTTYTLGQSVTYTGERWMAKKTNLGITPVEGADWARLITQSLNHVNRTSNTEITDTDRGKLFSCTGTFTQTIAAVSSLTTGWYCYLSNDGTGDITIDPNGSDLINGSPTLRLRPGNNALLTKAGTGINAVVSGEREVRCSSALTTLPSQSGDIFRISDTKVLVIYKMGGGASPAYEIRAQVATTTDYDTFTFGTAYGTGITSGFSYAPRAAYIGNNKWLLADYLSANSYRLTVLTVSGDVVSFGSPVTFTVTTASPNFLGLGSPSDDLAVITYQSTSAPAFEARKITVAGTVPSVSAATSMPYMSASSPLNASCRLTDTKMVLYSTESSGNNVIVVDLSGATPSVGTPSIGGSGVTRVSDTEFYSYAISGTNFGFYRFTVSGTVIIGASPNRPVLLMPGEMIPTSTTPYAPYDVWIEGSHLYALYTCASAITENNFQIFCIDLVTRKLRYRALGINVFGLPDMNGALRAEKQDHIRLKDGVLVTARLDTNSYTALNITRY